MPQLVTPVYFNDTQGLSLAEKDMIVSGEVIEGKKYVIPDEKDYAFVKQDDFLRKGRVDYQTP